MFPQFLQLPDRKVIDPNDVRQDSIQIPDIDY